MSLILQFVDILMIWSLIYNNPEIGLRVVLSHLGSADTLSVLMNTLMQYTLSTWSLLFGMNGSSCGLWHRHFAWNQITLVLIGKGMLLDGSTLKTRTTLDEYCNRFILCMWIYMSKYVFIYLFTYLYICLHSLVTGVSSGPNRSLGSHFPHGLLRSSMSKELWAPDTSCPIPSLGLWVGWILLYMSIVDVLSLELWVHYSKLCIFLSKIYNHVSCWGSLRVEPQFLLLIVLFEQVASPTPTLGQRWQLGKKNLSWSS